MKEKNNLSARTFQVIEGTGSQSRLAISAVNARAPGYATAHAQLEEERIRQAILRITLPTAKVSVAEAVVEWARLDAGWDDEKVQWRKCELSQDMQDFGLMYMHEDHGEPAHWVLSHPGRLLLARPELAPMYLRAHHFMTVAQEA